ncbi:hypothetical protein FACHB389_34865 [Nostoc calcicola FACHB-389]|nr:hypothetical protein FACHB389_34865 [Nostoc calcicola FACHB-389]
MVELYLKVNDPASNARNQGSIILSSRPRAGTTKLQSYQPKDTDENKALLVRMLLVQSPLNADEVS